MYVCKCVYDYVWRVLSQSEFTLPPNIETFTNSMPRFTRFVFGLPALASAFSMRISCGAYKNPKTEWIVRRLKDENPAVFINIHKL